MMKYFSLLLFLLPLYAQESPKHTPSPYDAAHLTTDSSILIEGVVHPLTGLPCLHSTDLIAPGVQEISLERIYLPSLLETIPSQGSQVENYYAKKELISEWKNSYRGWIFLPHLELKKEGDHLFLTQRNGLCLRFQKNEAQSWTFASSLEGIWPLREDSPSARWDPRNIEIQEEGSRFLIYLPEGTLCIYEKLPKKSYLLQKEVLPHGQILRYRYPRLKKGRRPVWQVTIESTDPQEQTIYASLSLEKHPQEGWSAHSHTGQSVLYRYETPQESATLKARIHYTPYHDRYCFPFAELRQVKTPAFSKETFDYDSSHSLQKYNGLQKLFQCTYETQGTIWRIKKWDPSFSEEPKEFLYSFSYTSEEKCTTVTREDGLETRYTFQDNGLCRSILYAHESQRREKRYLWNENHRLEALEWRDGSGGLFSRRSFVYDAKGNPVQETFEADLTGSGSLEKLVTQRSFSCDFRNLLLSEKTKDLETLYSYLPNTNLPQAILSLAKGRIFQRKFYEYSPQLHLVAYFEDDGTCSDPQNFEGVSERRIIRYVLQPEPPFLYRPMSKLELYEEDSQEKLLKRTDWTYDAQGKISQEKVYDAQNILISQQEFSYDAQGQILCKTNPLGEKTLLTYDEKGRLLSSLYAGLKESRLYTERGDLLEKHWEPIGGGSARKESHSYDPEGRLLETSGPFDQTLKKTYAPLQNGPLTIEESPLVDEQGALQRPKTEFLYDIWGRKIQETNPQGETTSYQYNAYHLPTRIEHPSGSIEKRLYDQQGRLISHEKEGCTLHYRYDSLGRKTQRTLQTTTGVMTQERWDYSPFHLLCYTDPEGAATHFLYDRAGRLIQKQKKEAYTRYSYDAFGYLSSIHESDLRSTLQKHDPLGRCVEKTQSNPDGSIHSRCCYRYDPSGNILSIQKLSPSSQSEEHFTYDPWGRCLEHRINELSFQYQYHEHYQNLLGQRFMKVTASSSDAPPISWMEDPQGRIHSRSIGSGEEKRYFYNLLGQLVRIEEGVHCTRYMYNSEGRLTSSSYTEGPEEELIRYVYDPEGRLAEKIFSDSTHLQYMYTPSGRLKQVTVFDGDQTSYLLCTEQGQGFWGKDLERLEALKNKVRFQHDPLDRLTQIDLPDHSSILYEYEGWGLDRVRRLSADNIALYQHQYLSFDEEGRVQEELLPFARAKVSYHREGLYEKTVVHTLQSTQTFEQKTSLAPFDLWPKPSALEEIHDRHVAQTLFRWTAPTKDIVEIYSSVDTLQPSHKIATLDLFGALQELIVRGWQKRPIAIETEEAIFLPLLDSEGRVQRLWEASSSNPS